MYLQYVFLCLSEEFIAQLFLHEWVEELDECRVHSLGSLGIPLLHQSTELILLTHMHAHVLRDEKEGRKKQARSNKHVHA